jgi:magnesium-transporting ATPase (P-type)
VFVYTIFINDKKISTTMGNSRIFSFIGSLLVMAIAIGIFFMLMEKEMPQSNRELLIAFVSVLFGAMATSIKKITGDDEKQ